MGAIKQIEKKLPYPIPADRAWFDPRLIALNTDLTVTDVSVPAGTPTIIAPADPGRCAVGFYWNAAVRIGPWTDPNLFATDAAVAAGSAWYDLFTYFTLVQLPWTAIAGGGATVRVVSVRRL